VPRVNQLIQGEGIEQQQAHESRLHFGTPPDCSPPLDASALVVLERVVADAVLLQTLGDNRPHDRAEQLRQGNSFIRSDETRVPEHFGVDLGPDVISLGFG
jgi:hypothetical protein